MNTTEELNAQVTTLKSRLEKAKETFREQKAEIEELRERVAKADKMRGDIKSAINDIALSMKDLTVYIKALNDVVNV